MKEYEVEFTIVSTFKKKIRAENDKQATALVQKGLTLDTKDLVESKHVDTRLLDEHGNAV